MVSSTKSFEWSSSRRSSENHDYAATKEVLVDVLVEDLSCICHTSDTKTDLQVGCYEQDVVEEEVVISLKPLNDMNEQNTAKQNAFDSLVAQMSARVLADNSFDSSSLTSDQHRIQARLQAYIQNCIKS